MTPDLTEDILHMLEARWEQLHHRSEIEDNIGYNGAGNAAVQANEIALMILRIEKLKAERYTS